MQYCIRKLLGESFFCFIFSLFTKKTAADGKRQEIIVLDSKRSNAINIGLTVLPPPRTIKTAILNFDEYALNKEGIEVRKNTLITLCLGIMYNACLVPLVMEKMCFTLIVKA